MTPTTRVKVSDETASDSALARPHTARRILRGLTANVAGNGVTVVVQLISVPVLLGAWGVSTYGEWLVLSAIPLYVALSDLGFSTVAGNRMTMLAGNGQRAEAIRLGRQAWSVVLALTVLAVLVAIAIGVVIVGWFGTASSIPVGEARLVVTALFAQVAVTNGHSVLDTWYRTAGRYPLGVALRQVGRLLEFGALLVAVVVGGGPGAAAAAFLAGGVSGLGLSWFVLRRAVPWSSFRFQGPFVGTIRQLLSPGLAFLAFPLSNAMSLQGMTIVVGATLGPAALVVFATTRTMTRVALQMMMSVNLAIWPELSRSIGSGRLDEARTIQRRAVQLSLLASVGLAMILAVLGPSFVRTWTHGLVEPAAGLLAVLLLVLIGNTFWFTLTTSLAATNQHVRMAIVYLGSTSTALILAVWLTLALGLIGPALALLAIDVGMSIYVFPAALRVVGDRPGQFLRSLLDIRGMVRSVWTVGGARTAPRSPPNRGDDLADKASKSRSGSSAIPGTAIDVRSGSTWNRLRVWGSAARLRPPTLRGLDMWAFVLPAVSFLEIMIIGRLIVTEILLLVMLPWLLRAPDRPQVPRWFVVLWAGWLLSQIVTDVVVGSTFTDYARGWAGIAFTLTNFAGILVLASTQRRARIFAIGLAVAGLLGFLFVPNPNAAADPWKWGLAVPVGLLVAAGLSGRASNRMPWFTVVAFAALGTLNLLLGYRSLGGITMLAAGYLGLSAIVSRRRVPARPSPLRTVLGIALIAAAAVGVFGIYSAAAANGLLGPEARAKYVNQAGAFGALLGGRPEALVSTKAVLDSPILGHGSWPKDPSYAALLVKLQKDFGYEVTQEYVGAKLIPTHSYLLGAWVWAGFLGAVFWFAVAGIAVWLLGNLYLLRVEIAPLLVISALLVLWDVGFSPYASFARITAPYALALCLLGLRLLREAQSIPPGAEGDFGQAVVNN